MKNQKLLTNYIPDFLSYCSVEKKLSRETIKNYRHFLTKFVYFTTDKNYTKLKVGELTEQIVWEYRLYLEAEKLEVSTQMYYLTGLRNFLRYLAEKEVKSLPPEKIKLARNVQRKEIKVLKVKEIEKILSMPCTDTNLGLRDRTILEVFVSTGIRLSELANLNFLKIEKEQKDLEISITGKGGKTRPIYFSERCVEWLRLYLESRCDDTDYLFTTKYGDKAKGIKQRTVQKMVEKYAKQADIKKQVSPHDFRHFFASNLLANGVDLYFVQKFLGHSSPETTARYLHITNSQLKNIHNKVFKDLTIKTN